MSTMAVSMKQEQPQLRLSPLLRFAIATAVRAPGRPVLLPLKIPRRCCGEGFKCRGVVQWAIFDGINVVRLCRLHFETYVESQFYTLGHRCEHL